MPRKGPAQRRELTPDPIYRSLLVAQIVNKVMLHGKRSVAEKIVYDALKIVEEKSGAEPIATLKRAIDNIKPPLEVKSRRVGGATYQVPMEVRPRRASTLAIRWLVDFSRARREKTMAECLAGELLDAGNGLGCVDQASRRHAEDGREQQGVRPLSLVSPTAVRHDPVPPKFIADVPRYAGRGARRRQSWFRKMPYSRSSRGFHDWCSTCRTAR